MEKDRFFKAYANIPLNLRKEIVLVIDKEPITWSVANNEINHDTEKGEKILSKLIELGII
jgi:hypothetical protein